MTPPGQRKPNDPPRVVGYPTTWDLPGEVPSGPRRLRVALVSSEHGWHGGEAQAFALAKGLRRRGHACLILARQGGEFARRIAGEGFQIGTFLGRGRSPLDLWRIRRHLIRFGPDVLHMNDAHALTGGMLASFGLDVPASIVSRRVDFPVRSALRYRHSCDRILCVSRSVVRACHASGIPAGQLRLVHDGVDPEVVDAADRGRGRRAMGVDADRRLLLTVASLTDCKGHRYLLEAMAAVVKEFPEVQLALAGDGELADALKQQTRRLGLEENVRFLGYRDDVPDLIKAADLFVMPSHTEGLCSSIIDAMLARRPIVTTTAGGIPDLVGSDSPDEEPVAWMVPPRDVGELAEAMLDALESPELWPELGRRARQRALNLFTSDRMVASTLAVYREVLDEVAATRKAA